MKYWQPQVQSYSTFSKDYFLYGELLRVTWGNMSALVIHPP